MPRIDLQAEIAGAVIVTGSLTPRGGQAGHAVAVEQVLGAAVGRSHQPSFHAWLAAVTD